MSGENGEPKQPEQPQIIEMRIIAELGKPMQVMFPGLADKLTTYGFLKMAEKVLDAHYHQQDPKIVQPKGSIMDFVRGKK